MMDLLNILHHLVPHLPHLAGVPMIFPFLITADKPSVTDSTAVSEPALNVDVSDPKFTVSDSSATTDAITPEIISSVALVDSTAVADTPAIALISFPNVTDPTAVSDTPTIEAISLPAVSDSSAISETVALILISTGDSMNVTDSAPVTDSPIISVPIAPVLAQESSGVSETLSMSGTEFVQASEPLSVIDSTSATIPTLFIVAADTSTMTEAFTVKETTREPVALDSVAVTTAVTLRVARPMTDSYQAWDFVSPVYTVQLGWQRARYTLIGDQL